jgi:CHAT domain-containing protein
MDAYLITGAGWTRYTWRMLGQEPFTEAGLNAKIDAMRTAIEQRRTPVALRLGEELYRILLQEPLFDKELGSIGADLILLSLDRRLRYLPFAALRTSEGFLAEKYTLVMLTDAARDNLSDPPSDGTPTIRAFGTTTGIAGFQPLRHVASELKNIVRLQGDPEYTGFIEGTSKLDDQFTLEAFQDAFVRPASGPRNSKIVHIASHFQFSEREGNSFLLLGNGASLTVKEIKDNGIVYDFGDVDLLALSACATGYASGLSAQGQDLESFAAVAQQKGVRAVLATLWPVADSSTAAFMERFYRLQIEQKMPRARALAAAQKEFITSGMSTRSDPFFWAPFVLLGNWL